MEELHVQVATAMSFTGQHPSKQTQGSAMRHLLLLLGDLLL